MYILSLYLIIFCLALEKPWALGYGFRALGLVPPTFFLLLFLTLTSASLKYAFYPAKCSRFLICQRCTGQGKDLTCILNLACGPSSDFRGRCSAYIGRKYEFTPTRLHFSCAFVLKAYAYGLQYTKKPQNSSWFVKLMANI